MKDHLFLFIGGHENMDSLSPEEMQAHMRKWTDWIGKMREDGIYLGGNPLEGQAKTLTAADVITDGPFAEAKELVGGYMIVKVRDLSAAAEVAKACPIFENGGRVEVRPIREMNPAA